VTDVDIIFLDKHVTVTKRQLFFIDDLFDNSSKCRNSANGDIMFAHGNHVFQRGIIIPWGIVFAHGDMEFYPRGYHVLSDGDIMFYPMGILC